MPLITKKRKPVFLAAILAVNLLSCLQLSVQPGCARPEQNNISVVDEHIGDRPYAVCRVLIKARPDQVWQVITDYGGATNVFTTLKKCQVLLDRGTTKVVRYLIKPSGLMASFEYDLEVREQPNKSVEWHRVAGDFKAVDGFWKLEPMECGRSTLVTYASYVNGGFLMPQALIKRQSHIDLPQVMASLKNHAETTMHIASHAAHSTGQ